jgi:hypothetical protein
MVAFIWLLVFFGFNLLSQDWRPQHFTINALIFLGFFDFTWLFHRPPNAYAHDY